MEATGKFREQVKHLFSELEEASLILILGREGADIDLFTHEAPVELISVNSFKTHKAYGVFLRKACNRLLEQAMVVQTDLRPGQRSAFLNELKDELGVVVKAQLIKPGKKAERKKYDRSQSRRYLFRTITVDIGPERKASAQQEDQLRKVVFRYAEEWRKVIRETRTQIGLLAAVVEHLPDRQVQNNKTVSFSKIIINGTEARLAVLARAFYEINVFAERNKASLCQNFCQSFGTHRAAHLSPRVFRNKFDCPNEDDIDYMIRELDGLFHVLVQFKERYN
ncbi:MAG: hypothetical protein WCI71_09030 [Bacteroidota bacterium]